MDKMTFRNLTSTIMTAISAYYPSSSSTTTSLTTRQISGTGPYSPETTFSPLLTSHTIYQPTNFLATASSLPVIIWANNVCNATTKEDTYKELNEELASWGMLVLACGDPKSALSFVKGHAGKDEWAKMDKDKVGMVGTGCAGGDVYVAAEDLRALSLAIFDFEDAVSTRQTKALAANATLPIFWFSSSTSSGIVSDDTSTSGVRGDFDAVAQGVPAWYGVLPGTDGQMLHEGSAGKMGRAGRFWAQWMVGGNQTASEFFVDAAGAESEGWTVARKGANVLVS